MIKTLILLFLIIEAIFAKPNAMILTRGDGNDNEKTKIYTFNIDTNTDIVTDFKYVKTIDGRYRSLVYHDGKFITAKAWGKNKGKLYSISLDGTMTREPDYGDLGDNIYTGNIESLTFDEHGNRYFTQSWETLNPYAGDITVNHYGAFVEQRSMYALAYRGYSTYTIFNKNSVKNVDIADVSEPIVTDVNSPMISTTQLITDMGYPILNDTNKSNMYGGEGVSPTKAYFVGTNGTQNMNDIYVVDGTTWSSTRFNYLAHTSGSKAEAIAIVHKIPIKPPFPSSCENSFASILNSTQDILNLGLGNRIYTKGHPLVTNEIFHMFSRCKNSPDSKESTCPFTRRLAPKYDFDIESEANPGCIISYDVDHILDNNGSCRNLIFLPYGKNEIKKDVTLKINESFGIATGATLNIDGHVTIYAKSINIGSKKGFANINIKSGSLTLIASDKIYFIANTNAPNIPGAADLVMLAKDYLYIHTPDRVNGIFYSNRTITYVRGEVIGSLTAPTISIGGAGGVTATYDRDMVNNFCSNIHISFPKITIDDVTKAEGDSDITNFEFHINLDIASDKDITIDYKTQDGSAKVSDSDYIGKSGSVTIPAGETSKTITIKVNGDNIKELDEKFFVKLTSAINATISDATGVGTITNDDKLKFDVWESLDEKYIKTKVVDDTLKLLVVALDKDGNLVKPKATNIQVALYSGNTQLTLPTTLVFETSTHMSVDFKSLFKYDFNGKKYDFTHQAFKDVVAKVSFTDINGTKQTSTSKDNFAIRPDTFKITAPSIVKAGDSFTLKIDALSKTGKIVTNYNQTQNSTYKLDINDTKYGTSNLSKYGFATTGYNFLSGNINSSITYNEAGEINIKIYEDPNNYFAKVDGEKSYISSDSVKIRFIPDHFKVDYTLTNQNNNPQLTFISNDLNNMSSKLSFNIRAVTSSGTITTRYTKNGYSLPTTLKLKNSVNSSNKKQTINHLLKKLNISKSKDITKTLTTDFSISKNSFKNGEFKDHVLINFKREKNKALEPIKLFVDELDLDETSGTGGYKTSGKNTTKNSVKLYYSRVHAPSPQNEAGTELDAKVYYEVYCKSCDKSNFVLAKGQSSIDEIYWYILPHSVYSQLMTNTPNNFTFDSFSTTANIKSHDYKGAGSNDYEIYHIEINKAPDKNRVYYHSYPYLMYNRFNATIAKHSFDIVFTRASNNWAGQGKLGYTVDTNISQQGIQSLEW